MLNLKLFSGCSWKIKTLQSTDIMSPSKAEYLSCILQPYEKALMVLKEEKHICKHYC